MGTQVAPLSDLLGSALDVEHERIVREDIETFRSYSAQWVAGEINDDQFRAQRLRRGIYTQRQPGVHMIRTKVPGGILTAAQMDQLGTVAEKWAGGKGHLTTRQNLQYHFVPLKDVPDALHALADARLTTREACYNTVRNVTACPLSGLLEDEPFDVQPYARKVAFAFLHKQLTDAMPRKFKIAFSGCKDDCMVGAIHDVGLRALIRDGRRGFRMVCGGGLGPLPNEAQVLEEFVAVEDLVSKCEAVLRVFNKYGNRANKNKARLKFVIRERGFAWFKEQVDKEYSDIRENGGIATPEAVPEGFGGFQSSPPPLGQGELLPVLKTNGHPNSAYENWLATNVRQQKQEGYCIVTVRVPQGNLTAEQMHGLADLARNTADGLLRFGIDQNVMIGWIPGKNLQRVYAVLQALELAESGAHEIDDVLTCPGAYSCNLGLTKSMNLGEALGRHLQSYTDPLIRTLRINISGCPNSCGQHWIGDLGFYGNARKINGEEVPYYQMLLGGGYDRDGNMRFGLAIQSLPAKSAPMAVDRVLKHYAANREEGESFRDYVLRFKIETFRAMTSDLAKPAEYAPDMYQDWGDSTPFSLKLGRGECAS